MDNTVGFLQSFLSPDQTSNTHFLHWMLGTGHTCTIPASNIRSFQHFQPKTSELGALPWCLGEFSPTDSSVPLKPVQAASYPLSARSRAN